MKSRENDEIDNLRSIKDIHSRIESLDQSIRSVNNRLRAVEKRISVKIPKSGGNGIEDDGVKEDLYLEVEELRGSIELLSRSVSEILNHERQEEIEQKFDRIEKIINEEQLIRIDSLNEQFSNANDRIAKLENLNRITIGKIKIPIELSGLIAAIVLIGTGYLIANDQWNVVRSFYYPVSLGILFGAVVIAKFLMTNRDAI